MISRVSLSLIIVLLFVPILLLGFSKTENSCEEVNTLPKVKIPAIDAAMPAEIETATFALG